MNRKFCLCVYYGFARWLPSSAECTWKFPKKIRYYCCKNIFKSIGKHVMMGPNCFMLEKTHRFERTDIPMMFQGARTECERDQVIIGDDVWIGREVMIIGSREIKTGSIIGARCVLTKSFPEYSIIGGGIHQG